MGVYDIYAGVQLKVGDVCCRFYKLGDKVKLRDGIYVGYEGFVIIKKKVLVAFFPVVFTKWGGVIMPEDMLVGNNPIEKCIEEVGKKNKKRRVRRKK